MSLTQVQLREALHPELTLCLDSFTGGIIEMSMSLPGTPDAQGFWPAAWTMGNLGRAGYGATTEGVWPYSCVANSLS